MGGKNSVNVLNPEAMPYKSEWNMTVRVQQLYQLSGTRAVVTIACGHRRISGCHFPVTSKCVKESNKAGPSSSIILSPWVFKLGRRVP